MLANLLIERTKWLIHCEKQLIKLAPNIYKTVFLLSFFLMFAEFLSQILPIKVILLAGSENVPTYFPKFINQTNKSRWILLLAFLTITLYILVQYIGYIISKKAEHCISPLTRHLSSEPLYDKQDKVVTNYFILFIEVLSLTAFIAVSIIILLIIDPLTAAILFIVHGIYFWATKIRIKGNMLITFDEATFLKVLHTIGFSMLFLAIVFSHLIGENKNIIISLISFLLARRVLQCTTKIVKKTIYLYNRKDRVDALFLQSIK